MKTPRANFRSVRRNTSRAQEAELDNKRRELGVEDAVKDVPGVTTKMMVALGENGVKTGRGSRRLRNRRSCRLDRAQGRRDVSTSRDSSTASMFHARRPKP